MLLYLSVNRNSALRIIVSKFILVKPVLSIHYLTQEQLRILGSYLSIDKKNSGEYLTVLEKCYLNSLSLNL